MYTVNDVNEALAASENLEQHAGDQWEVGNDYNSVAYWLEESHFYAGRIDGVAQWTPIDHTLTINDVDYAAEAIEVVGGEGGGDQAYLVFSLTNANDVRYFRVDGYYQSYDGRYLDGDLHEVRPVERTVTFYE